jgi:hypothetical protein
MILPLFPTYLCYCELLWQHFPPVLLKFQLHRIYQVLHVQLGARNFGHQFSVTSKNCDVNHSLLSVTFKSQILKFIFCSRQFKIVANGKIEVNNVKPILYIDSVARNSVSRTVGTPTRRSRTEIHRARGALPHTSPYANTISTYSLFENTRSIFTKFLLKSEN